MGDTNRGFPAHHKGFWFRVHLENGDEKDITGFTSRAELQYRMRKFINTPHVVWLQPYAGEKRLGFYEIIVDIEGRKHIMSNTGNMDFDTFEEQYVPPPFEYGFASATEKETLVAFEIPFVIEAVNVVKSNFPDQFGKEQNDVQYRIALETDDPSYEFARGKKEINPNYTLTFVATDKRLKQLESVIKPMIANGGCRAILVKQGRSYNFAKVPPAPIA